MSSNHTLKLKVYKWCIVPLCTNTTYSSSKLFIHVPKKPEIRNKWISACRRNLGDISEKSTVFCCEDHFDMENDMENWLKYKIMGGQIKMKPGVVPHIFQCQADNKGTLNYPRRHAIKRLQNESFQHAIGSEEKSKALSTDEASRKDSCDIKVSMGN